MSNVQSAGKYRRIFLHFSFSQSVHSSPGLFTSARSLVEFQVAVPAFGLCVFTRALAGQRILEEVPVPPL